MKFKKLIVKDFQSLETIDFNFPNGLVLIDGWNEDLSSHNGVGKSALLNSITYAIYGKVPKNVVLGSLIRDDCDSLSTSIEIELKDKLIEIKRSRTPKSSRVKLKINGEQTQGMSKQTEEQIVGLIGLTFEQFIQVIYVFQGSTNRFIDLNDTEKKRFLSTILNLEVYDKAYKAAHAELNEKELQLAHADGKLVPLIDEEIRLKREIADISSNLETMRQQKEQKIGALEVQVNDIKKEMKELEAQKLKADNKSAVQGLETKRAGVLEQQRAYEQGQRIIREYQRKMDTYTREITQLTKENEQLNSDKCPTCGQEWSSWDDKRAAEIADNTEKQQGTQKQLDLIITEKNEYAGVLANVDEVGLRKAYELATEEIAHAKSEGPEKFDLSIQIKHQELGNISQQMNIYTTEFETAGKLLERSQTRMTEVSALITQYNKAGLTLNAEKEILLETKKVFSPTGVRAHVFSNIIQQLNGAIATYLDQLTGGLFKFSLYSNEEKGKFTEELEYMGRPRGVTALSGGEFKRISLAIDLALAEIICARTSVFPNVLFIDEGMNGLDVSGREAMMEVLTDMARFKDIYMVDHASEFKASFSSTFNLVKRNGKTNEKKEEA